MTNASDWQGTVGRSWASEWRRTDISFSELTPRLLAKIRREPGSTVVDIGCGAGELAIAVAEARPEAQVTGVDISADLVETARSRNTSANLTFALADAAQWRPALPPDLYVSRHGVMFFSDPPAAFAHLAAQAAPGARMVFSCFRKPAENDWAAAIAALLPKSDSPLASPTAPGPFAFALPDHVRRCMAGWHAVEFEPVDFRYIAGSGPDAVAEAMALFRRIGPAAAALRTLPEAERGGVEQRLADLVQAHHHDGVVAFNAAAWLVSATSDHNDG
ncbi:MAG: class I SAM-dependent methyltransferase [Novosphingobium sp.]